MKQPVRIVIRLLWLLLAGLLLCGIGVGAVYWYLTPGCRVTEGITYGRRNGQELKLTILQPESPNGIGIMMMVSGSWKSSPSSAKSWMAAPLLRQGETVFAVSHLSQPGASVQEIVADVERASRWAHLHAKDYGVDPARIGVTGGSSGGHLSLMLATCGAPGDPNAADPVDRQSSAVAAAAVFFPVTDLLNLGPSTENLHDGGPPKSFRHAFGPNGEDLREWQKIGRDLSPIDHVTTSLPPIWIIHGDADTLVPLDQSQRFRQRAAAAGREVELTVRHGAKHGWLTMLWDLRQMGQWFAKVLPSCGTSP